MIKKRRVHFMTNAETPKICRNCPNCEQYIEVGVFMPSWTPWKWRCKADKRPCICENEETSLDNSAVASSLPLDCG